MKKRGHALQIQKDNRELINRIGIAAVLVALLVWILLPRSLFPLKVDISYGENEAVFISMSPAETNEDWYLHPEYYTKQLEKYPELHAERYEESIIYHSSYRVVLKLPVLITSKERKSIDPIVYSIGFLSGDDWRYLGYGRYLALDGQYNSYLDGAITNGQTIKTFEYFDFYPDEFEQASHIELRTQAYIVERERDLREGKGPTIFIEITEDIKSRINAEGERIMEDFAPPDPIALSPEEYAEWELDSIIINAYVWADEIMYQSEAFGRRYSNWHGDSFGYHRGSCERQTDGDSIVTIGKVGFNNKDYRYEMEISIDSWRVTRLVVGDVVLV